MVDAEDVALIVVDELENVAGFWLDWLEELVDITWVFEGELEEDRGMDVDLDVDEEAGTLDDGALWWNSACDRNWKEGKAQLVVGLMEDVVVPKRDVLIVAANVGESFVEEALVVDICLVELVKEDDRTLVEEDGIVEVFAVGGAVDAFVVLWLKERTCYYHIEGIQIKVLPTFSKTRWLDYCSEPNDQ